MRKSFFGLIVAAFIEFAPLGAHAGIPVIDAANLAQAVQQVTAWAQQYQQMAQQLQRQQQQISAITGGRGMENVLPMSNLARNYLPPDYAQVTQVVNGTSSTYSGLSGQVQSIVAANVVLSSTQLAAMTPEQRQIVEQGRRSAALLSAMTQTAQQNTSQRFAGLQQLMNQIAAAGDEKAILDLQGRVSVEQAMLTNEANKLQALYQSSQAEQLLQQQRIREQRIAGHGSFSSRFAPTP